MKNKKLVNLYLLTLSLLALISFILPFEKINPSSLSSLGTTIVYYTVNVILLISLVLIILISIINLFQNSYEAIKYSVAFSFLAFIMVFVNVIIYSANLNMALSWGTIVLLVEVFVLFSFNSIVKSIKAFKDFGPFLAKLFPRKKDEEVSLEDTEVEEVAEPKEEKSKKNKEDKTEEKTEVAEFNYVADAANDEVSDNKSE